MNCTEELNKTVTVKTEERTIIKSILLETSSVAHDIPYLEVICSPRIIKLEIRKIALYRSIPFYIWILVNNGCKQRTCESL